MATERELVCCHEMEQIIRSLEEDPHPEIHPSCITHMPTLIMCICVELCLLSPCIHIYIAINVLKYLMMRIGSYAADHAIQFCFIYCLSSTSDLQPSTAISNQLTGQLFSTQRYI